MDNFTGSVVCFMLSKSNSLSSPTSAETISQLQLVLGHYTVNQ